MKIVCEHTLAIIKRPNCSTERYTAMSQYSSLREKAVNCWISVSEENIGHSSFEERFDIKSSD